MSARIPLTSLPARYQAQAVAQLAQTPAPGSAPAAPAVSLETPKDGRQRLRQRQKPLMNANEEAFGAYLSMTLPNAKRHPQAVTLGLANGVRYTPDWMTFEPFSGRLCFWEVKGTKKIFDGAGEKLKIAAAQYREFVFTLVWREGGEWQQQRIKP